MALLPDLRKSQEGELEERIQKLDRSDIGSIEQMRRRRARHVRLAKKTSTELKTN